MVLIIMRVDFVELLPADAQASTARSSTKAKPITTSTQNRKLRRKVMLEVLYSGSVAVSVANKDVGHNRLRNTSFGEERQRSAQLLQSSIVESRWNIPICL